MTTKKAKTGALILDTGSASVIHVACPYDTDWIAWAKAHKGTWQPSTMTWKVPISMASTTLQTSTLVMQLQSLFSAVILIHIIWQPLTSTWTNKVLSNLWWSEHDSYQEAISPNPESMYWTKDGTTHELTLPLLASSPISIPTGAIADQFVTTIHGAVPIAITHAPSLSANTSSQPTLSTSSPLTPWLEGVKLYAELEEWESLLQLLEDQLGIEGMIWVSRQLINRVNKRTEAMK